MFDSESSRLTSLFGFRILFLLNIVILYSLWWLYFDDFSEDVGLKSSAYLEQKQILLAY